MRRFSAVSAAALLLATTPALAQTERAPYGSGVVPAEVANSAERPIRFATQVPVGGVLAIPMAGAADLSQVPTEVADAVRGAVAAAGFEASSDETLSLYDMGGYSRLLLVGTDEGQLNAVALANLGGRIAQETRDAAAVSVVATGLSAAVPNPAAHVARGVGLGQYRFDRLKTRDRTTPELQPITIIADQGTEAIFNREHAGMVDAMRLVRDLIALPSNLKYPESFVNTAREAFRGVPNVRITVLDEPQMRQLNMGALLSVSQGSRRPARMMIVDYRGAGDNSAPLALVGKGITFDTGGISLKPGAGMEAMRGDMAGAAGVLGAVLAAARRGADANVVAVAALAENMPGGNASRPGDVVRTMNGTTIEYISTDAEGRMVLSDANQYVIDRYQPVALVNLATLTGAITTALGDDYAGLFARDDALAARVEAAAATSGDAVWRMPIHPSYAEDMASPLADIANGTRAPGPGAGRAAYFLSFVTPEPTPWAHIDMAGVDQVTGTPILPEGAPGYGVRLFDDLIRSFER